MGRQEQRSRRWRGEVEVVRAGWVEGAEQGQAGAKEQEMCRVEEVGRIS